MARLNTVDPNQATGKAKELLDGVQSQLKIVPNLMKVLANSPAALEAYLSFDSKLSHGSLKPKLRELISVVVAEENSCEYCLSAHTAIGKMVGLNDEQIRAGRKFHSGDAKIDAALHFAHDITVRRGQVDNSAIEAVRKAGYTDGEIAEIIANVGLNLFTNYFNNAVKTEVDFPHVAIDKAASA
ncbi:MAG TPA: carboxymuconolactone decarboxylase family protein [Candidatus Acidoferrum sp.]|nr:carboxymuconolactone decarboxylase family protein [Candidatus Acidoferrum sp.]